MPLQDTLQIRPCTLDGSIPAADGLEKAWRLSNVWLSTLRELNPKIASQL